MVSCETYIIDQSDLERDFQHEMLDGEMVDCETYFGNEMVDETDEIVR